MRTVREPSRRIGWRRSRPRAGKSARPAGRQNGIVRVSRGVCLLAGFPLQPSVMIAAKPFTASSQRSGKISFLGSRTRVGNFRKNLNHTPTLARSCSICCPSSRTRWSRSGNCCTAIICRFACRSGAAGMPRTRPPSGTSRMTPDLAPTTA